MNPPHAARVQSVSKLIYFCASESFFFAHRSSFTADGVGAENGRVCVRAYEVSLRRGYGERERVSCFVPPPKKSTERVGGIKKSEWLERKRGIEGEKN